MEFIIVSIFFFAGIPPFGVHLRLRAEGEKDPNEAPTTCPTEGGRRKLQ